MGIEYHISFAEIFGALSRWMILKLISNIVKLINNS